VLTTLTGVAYPLLLGLLAQGFFPRQAQGSLVRARGRVVGSALISQGFTDPGDFWGRPIAAGGGGSNRAPGEAALAREVEARATLLKGADPDQPGPVPGDLLTASGSGADPHITPEAAVYQAHRVAKARGLTEARVRALVDAHTQSPQWGILGRPRVNVLELNLALDRIQIP
jgi:K+-transporting ATPase ATPase C chain